MFDHAVVALDEDGLLIGTVRLTTARGDQYKGTDWEGEPVWETWNWSSAANGAGHVLHPLDVAHWMEIPDGPAQ